MIEMVFAALAATSVASAGSDASKKDEPQNWVVFAERVYTGTGHDWQDGAVLVAGRKIGGVVPSGAEADPGLGLHCYAVTAGLIDLSMRAESNFSSVEQSSETTPELRVADALDPFSPRWERVLSTGVTTALVNPLDQNVIGGLGVVVKTAGPESIEGRTLKKDAVLRGAMGAQPSQSNHPAFGRPTDFFSRRPTTRMAVEWIWRKTFLEDVAAGLGDKQRSARGQDVLVAALEGTLPLSIQAWTTQDIRTAVFLKEEIERDAVLKSRATVKPRLIIDAAAEAWKEPQLLARSNSAVVLPPFPAAGRTRENAFMAWDVASELKKQGVTFALSAHGSDDYDSSLGMQAGYAMRGGLSFADALAAVTTVPAKLVGIDDRVGTLAVGKDADLCLWNGEPFQPTSRVIGVIVDGVLRIDPRPAKAD